MCNCPNSPWVQEAKTFLANNKSNQDEKWYTVNFLLNYNHCGIDNRVKIEDILQHLNTKKINLTKEEFQQDILSKLKKDGIIATLVYPGSQGGVFIPCNEDDVRKAANQILKRVNSEIQNLAGISKQTSFSNLVSLLAQIISWIKGKI